MASQHVFTVAQKYTRVSRFAFYVRPHLCVAFPVSCSFVSRSRFPLPILRLPFSGSRSPFHVRRFSFLVVRSAFSIPRSPFLVRRFISRSPFFISRSPFLISRLPFLISHSPVSISFSVSPQNGSTGSKGQLIRITCAIKMYGNRFHHCTPRLLSKR